MTLETMFDWITVIIFSGLIVLFLQRSSAAEPRDSLWQYFPPAVGCAVANYLGNEGQTIVAILLVAGIFGYIWVVLKPLEGWTRD